MQLSDIVPQLPTSRLVLGTNVFGWTADLEESKSVLDAYIEAGGNFLDTADSYSKWAPGNPGGVSESIIGAWISERGNRESVVIATKVAQHPDFAGLDPKNIRRALDASNRRLRTELIDLYYAHFDDPDVPLEEIAGTFSALVDEGRIRAIGVSNFTAERVAEWLKICERDGLHPPVAWEPQYSLVERGIENDVLPLARKNGLQVIPYYVLARGFLTGKYSSGAVIDSPRANDASVYLDERGKKILEVLDEISGQRGLSPASVALAWVAAQEGIGAVIASARNLAQLPALVEGAELSLSDTELSALDSASQVSST